MSLATAVFNEATDHMLECKGKLLSLERLEASVMNSSPSDPRREEALSKLRAEITKAEMLLVEAREFVARAKVLLAREKANALTLLAIKAAQARAASGEAVTAS